MNPPRPEASLRNLESPPLPQQQVLRRHAHVLEFDFHVAVGRIIETKYRQIPQDGDTWGVARHQNHRLLAVPRRARVGLSHEYEQPAARAARAGGPPLAPVDEVAGALTDDGALDVGGIARGYARLGHRKGGTNRTVEQRLEPLLLLGRGAVALERLHVAGVGRRTVEHLGRPAHPAHHLAQRRVLEVAEPRAVGRVGQEQVPQPSRLRLLPQLLEQRGLLPAIACAALRIEALLVRIDVLIHERAETPQVVPGPCAEFEIHGVTPAVSARTGARAQRASRWRTAS